MPLEWDDVKEGLTLADYTIKSAPQILKSRQHDPMLSLLTLHPDLGTILDRLAGRL